MQNFSHDIVSFFSEFQCLLSGFFNMQIVTAYAAAEKRSSKFQS